MCREQPKTKFFGNSNVKWPCDLCHINPLSTTVCPCSTIYLGSRQRFVFIFTQIRMDGDFFFFFFSGEGGTLFPNLSGLVWTGPQ